MFKVVIIGLGYIGLPTAVVFASKGFNVVVVDVYVGRVEAVNSGRCYIREPGLDVLLRDVVFRGLLRATTDVVEAVKESDAVIVAVPTPVRDGVVDLSYLRGALEGVKRGMRRDLLVVIESTVPPGTTAGFARSLLEESGYRVEEDFFLAHVPERIAPGRAVEELLNMPRVVGGVGPRSTEKAVELYSRVNSRLLTTDATTAEFVKLAENTYRDLNIAYANLLAVIEQKSLPIIYNRSSFGLVLKASPYYEFGSTSKFPSYIHSGLPVLVPQDYQYLSTIVKKYSVGIIF